MAETNTTYTSFLAPQGYKLFAEFLREEFPLEVLQHPLQRMSHELNLNESIVRSTLDFTRHHRFIEQDTAGNFYYPHIRFAELLERLSNAFRQQYPVPSTTPDACSKLSNDFFQASLFHVQHIFHIIQRRNKQVLRSKLTKIEYLRFLNYLWRTVFEFTPEIAPSSLPLLQSYFLLQNEYFQIDLDYLITQINTAPFCLSIINLLGTYSDNSDVNFPFELHSFAQSIGLNTFDTSILWKGINDMIAFLVTADERIQKRYTSLLEDYNRTASLLFRPVKGDEILASFTTELYVDQRSPRFDEVSPLEDIAILQKELTQYIEEQQSFNYTFLFIGQAGLGQRDAARILRHQYSQIENWPYSQGYYEWDLQKKLLLSPQEQEKLLDRYKKGCIYFHNFPLLSQTTLDEQKNLRALMTQLSELLNERMFIFEFVSSAYIQHYLPQLEERNNFVIRFVPYTYQHLSLHFKQLALLAEIDVAAEAYQTLRDVYEKAQPYFDRGGYADQFVYQLFATSLRQMSQRVKERYATSNLLLNSEIESEDLLEAFQSLLHL